MLHNGMGKGLMALIIIGSIEMTGCSQNMNKQVLGVHEIVELREIAFAQTMADRDMETFMTFISPEAVFFNGNKPISGRDAIVQAWAPYFKREIAPFSWHPDVVEVLESGRLAISSGPVHSASGESIGRFNSIWRLDEDGQWRVVFDKGE